MATRRTPTDLATRLTPEDWEARVAAADAEATLLAVVLDRVRAGTSRSEALREAFPDSELPSKLRRLRRFEVGGRDGLLNRHLPVTPVRKMDAEARGALRALAMADPAAGSVVLAERLSTTMGRSVRPSAVQQALRDLGLGRPKGRPPGRNAPGKPASPTEPANLAVVTPLPCAGAELLKAVNEDIGATAALTRALDAALAAIPKPTGPVHDDSGGRDEYGRFLAAYNEPRPRVEPELGERFGTVKGKRATKDLAGMRVVSESEETHLRKNLALTLLPVVVRGPRWSALDHWRGDHLGELVGLAYQSSTLDKYLRGLKYAGLAYAAREAVTSFWTRDEGATTDPATGAVLLYVDAKTKPLWTHHWTRATRVSETGRVMPAITTMTLHSGAGTPLVYRSWSGRVSLPQEVCSFLDTFEHHAGESTLRRVVVMDREAHAVWLFKSLEASGRLFIVPLRNSVVGPKARFEDVGAWTPYRDGPDEVSEGWLWLNDSRKGEAAVRTRVVARRRDRTGNIAWYATNTPGAEFSASDVIRLYFDRWPAQEHVYRDGSGIVGLDVNHGYGKQKVTDVAVLDRLERLDGRELRASAEKQAAETALASARSGLSTWEEALAEIEPHLAELRGQVAGALSSRRPRHEVKDVFDEYATFEGWLAETRRECARHRVAIDAALETIRGAEKVLRAVTDERALLERRRQIFTVDVELDELMTAFKLTFMNLCSVLMRAHLGTWMELETLVDAVLTLPGERVVTPEVELVRIFRPSRDEKVATAVEAACASLNARALRRGKRALRFEVVGDAAPRPARPRAGRDPVDP